MKEKDNKKKEKDAGESMNTIQQKLMEIEKTMPISTKGKITEIIETTSKIFFKDEKGKFNERNGFAVVVKIPVPQGKEDIEFTQFMSLPDSRGMKQSNVYAFKQKYGKYPEINMEVETFNDENGFYRILLD